jgi:membrane-associated phospholipid phosphatase
VHNFASSSEVIPLNRRLIAPAVIALILYLLLALGIELNLFRAIDLNATHVLQRLVPRSWDLALSVLSLLGSFEVTGAGLVAILFVFFRPRYRWPLLLLFGAILLFEGSGKLLINQPGPPHTLSRYAFTFSMPTGQVPTPFSFPSGHAARSMFLTGITLAWIGCRVPNRRTRAVLTALLFLVEAVMLVSRISLADHWTTDVVGGALIGLAASLPAFAAAREPVPVLAERRVA